MSNQKRALILEYWFRVVMGSDVSIKDISKIVLRFADPYEAFDKSTNWGIKVEKSGTLLSKLELTLNWLNVYGTVIAKEAALYHWQLKVIDFDEPSGLNIGIATANTRHYQGWAPSSYLYCNEDGKLWHESRRNDYGDSFGKGDIIHVWLNLKDNLNEIYFGKNDKRYKKAGNVECSAGYKLQVAIWGIPNAIELVSYTTSY